MALAVPLIPLGIKMIVSFGGLVGIGGAANTLGDKIEK